MGDRTLAGGDSGWRCRVWQHPLLAALGLRMDERLAALLASVAADMDRLALIDALREALRVDLAGVDIDALPRLPPELKPAAPDGKKP